MKFKLLLLTTLTVAAIANESHLRGDHDLAVDSFLFGERALGYDEDDFEKLEATYKSKEKKCIVKYRVKNKSTQTIEFDDIDESSDGAEVVCKEKTSKPDGVELPVKAYNLDAKWIEPDDDKAQVKYSKFTWTEDKLAKLTLKRKKADDGDDDDEDHEPPHETEFAKLSAKYRAFEKKCELTYRVKSGGRKTIKFDSIDESSDGRKVVCEERTDKPEGVKLPVTAKGFDATWTESDGDDADIKSSKFEWTDSRKAKLTLVRKKADEQDDMDDMDEDDFKQLIGKYNSKQKRCSLTYRVKGEDKETISFDKVDESSDGLSVTCKDDAHKTDGIHLPVDAKGFDAVWKGSGGDKSEVTKTSFKWKKNEKAVLYLKREEEDDDKPDGPMDEDDFKKLVARYKSREKKCSLTYKVPGEKQVTINLKHMDESDNGRRVVCYDKEDATDGVYLPVKAEDFDAVWKEKNGDAVDVEKSTLVWKKNKDIKLVLKREPNGMDGDDFDVLKIEYDGTKNKDKQCKLTYKVNGEGKQVVYLKNYVKERNGKIVCRQYNVEDDDVDLPVKAKDVRAKATDEHGNKLKVDTAELKWDEGDDIKVTIYLDDH